jgi:hypothetical protein
MPYGHNVTVTRDRPANQRGPGTYRARHVSGPSVTYPAGEGAAGHKRAVYALARRMGYQNPQIQDWGFSPSGKTARFDLIERT